MRRTINGARTKGSFGAKITNNTKIFGIMGGLAPMRNVRASTHIGYKVGNARMHQDIPLDPVKGLEYMLGRNPMGKYMLSKNPQCAGGVGKMALISSGPGSGAYSKPSLGKSTRDPMLLMSPAPAPASYNISISPAGATESFTFELVPGADPIDFFGDMDPVRPFVPPCDDESCGCLDDPSSGSSSICLWTVGEFRSVLFIWLIMFTAIKLASCTTLLGVILG